MKSVPCLKELLIFLTIYKKCRKIVFVENAISVFDILILSLTGDIVIQSISRCANTNAFMILCGFIYICRKET